MTMQEPLVLRQDSYDPDIYHAVKATFSGGKYRLEPEGDMFRVIATRQSRYAQEGERGGLVSGATVLSQEGDAWVDDGGVVKGHSRVTDDAFIGGGCMLTNARVSGGAYVVRTTASNVVISGCNMRISDADLVDTSLTHCTIEQSKIHGWEVSNCTIIDSQLNRSTGFAAALRFARLKTATIDSPHSVVAVATLHGLVTLARSAVTDSGYVITAGCKTYYTVDNFVRGAEDYGINSFEMAMLTPLRALMMRAVQLWGCGSPEGEVPA